MDSLPFAFIRSGHQLAVEAYSARPDAPVVSDAVRARPVRRTRTAAAGLLYRLADLTAPAQQPRAAASGRTVG